MTENISLWGKIVAITVAFFAPLPSLIGLMIFFMLADTISAIMVAYQCKKLHARTMPANGTIRRIRKFRLLMQAIDPAKLEKTTEKLFAYPLIGIVCFVFDRLLLDVAPEAIGNVLKLSVTNIAFALICATDLISFLRNMSKATGIEIARAVERFLTSKFKIQQDEADKQYSRALHRDAAECND